MSTAIDELLSALIDLSREFGGGRYVQGGGGNASAKTGGTLWIKASGTTLRDAGRELLVAMDRAKMARLYGVQPPAAPAAREALIKDLMLAAVRPGSAGRPSVEAPLHESFHAALVVHTHPPLVNGLLCSHTAQAACCGLFPDDLWVDYVDPGYSLCMCVREEIGRYEASAGRQPRAVLIGNHGLFVTGDTADEVRETTGRIMTCLQRRYEQAGVSTELATAPAAPRQEVQATLDLLRRTLGPQETAGVAVSPPFAVAQGPLTPDHIVYMKAHVLTGEPTQEAVNAFFATHTYRPRVIACRAGVFAVGPSQRDADVAMDLARDGALVAQLAAAFGGARFMDERAAAFIDTWEVEAYRRTMAGK